MKHLKFILLIIIVIFIVILMFENYDVFSSKVEYKFLYFKSPEISMHYIVAIAFFFGIVIGGIYGMIERFQLKKQIKSLIITSKAKDEELNSLRNLPITSDNVGSGHLNESGTDE